MDDCPWDADELEQFYEFATDDQYRQQQQPSTVDHQNQQFPRPNPMPNTYPNFPHNSPPPPSQYNTQMQYQHRIVAKGPNLQFPEFDGQDSDGWIRKAEKYFEMVGVPNEDRVKIAVMYIKGKAEFCWRGIGANSAQLPWHQFTRMVGDRFNEVSSYEIIGQFHTLKQTGSVSDYVDKFEELMGLVRRNNPSLSEAYFTHSFVSGLKEYIQHHLQCHKPTSLTQAYWFAKRLEQANPTPKKFNVFNPAVRQVKPWIKDPTEKEVKEDSNKNIAELRAAGKCFKCREQWIPGHAKVCKGKQLYSVIVMETENGIEDVAVVEDGTNSDEGEYFDAQPAPTL